MKIIGVSGVLLLIVVAWTAPLEAQPASEGCMWCKSCGFGTITVTYEKPPGEADEVLEGTGELWCYEYEPGCDGMIPCDPNLAAAEELTSSDAEHVRTALTMLDAGDLDGLKALVATDPTRLKPVTERGLVLVRGTTCGQTGFVALRMLRQEEMAYVFTGRGDEVPSLPSPQK